MSLERFAKLAELDKLFVKHVLDYGDHLLRFLPDRPFVVRHGDQGDRLGYLCSFPAESILTCTAESTSKTLRYETTWPDLNVKCPHTHPPLDVLKTVRYARGINSAILDADRFNCLISSRRDTFADASKDACSLGFF